MFFCIVCGNYVEGSKFYFSGIENNLLVMTDIKSKALVFPSLSACYSMCGLLYEYFDMLDFDFMPLEIYEDDQDFACSLYRKFMFI